jgi:uncharacterized damage-inducible protein DinB
MSADYSIVMDMFKTNTQLFERATQGIPAERWLARPGEDSNHLLWIAGHVVVHRAKVLRILGEGWSAPWENLFARGTIQGGGNEPPDVGEIQRAWQEVSEKLPRCLASAASEFLEKPVEAGRPSVNGKVGGTIAFLCLHETYHLGQMASLRKYLGYGQTVG